MEQALRCLGYLVGTCSCGILLCAGGPEEFFAFSDSDWAGDPITTRSIGGYVIYFGNSTLCNLNDKMSQLTTLLYFEAFDENTKKKHV